MTENEAPSRDWKSELPQNILAGLTVSFAAISLGAAFGLQSGRDNGIVIGIMFFLLLPFNQLFLDLLQN